MIRLERFFTFMKLFPSMPCDAVERAADHDAEEDEVGAVEFLRLCQPILAVDRLWPPGSPAPLGAPRKDLQVLRSVVHGEDERRVAQLVLFKRCTCRQRARQCGLEPLSPVCSPFRGGHEIELCGLLELADAPCFSPFQDASLSSGSCCSPSWAITRDLGQQLARAERLGDVAVAARGARLRLVADSA